MQVEEEQHVGRKRGGDDPGANESASGAVREVFVTVAAAVLIAFLIQALLVKPYRIPSGSMENTLNCGDRVLVDRISYRFSEPERGDIIVFHPPAAIDRASGTSDPGELFQPQSPDLVESGDLPFDDQKPADTNFIKRIVGMPGETLEIRDGATWIDGKKLDEPYLNPNRPDHDEGPFTVPEGTYFMLGDNRNNSHDSRGWGALKEEFVIGKAFAIYWPIEDIGGIPAKDPGDASPSGENPACLGRDVDLIGAGAADADTGVARL